MGQTAGGARRGSRLAPVKFVTPAKLARKAPPSWHGACKMGRARQERRASPLLRTVRVRPTLGRFTLTPSCQGFDPRRTSTGRAATRRAAPPALPRYHSNGQQLPVQPAGPGRDAPYPAGEDDAPP